MSSSTTMSPSLVSNVAVYVRSGSMHCLGASSNWRTGSAGFSVGAHSPDPYRKGAGDAPLVGCVEGPVDGSLVGRVEGSAEVPVTGSSSPPAAAEVGDPGHQHDERGDRDEALEQTAARLRPALRLQVLLQLQGTVLALALSLLGAHEAVRLPEPRSGRSAGRAAPPTARCPAVRSGAWLCCGCSLPLARRRASAVTRFTGRTVDDVLGSARDRYGDHFSVVLSTCRVWLNGDETSGDAPVSDGDEVAVLPPCREDSEVTEHDAPSPSSLVARPAAFRAVPAAARRGRRVLRPPRRPDPTRSRQGEARRRCRPVSDQLADVLVHRLVSASGRRRATPTPPSCGRLPKSWRSCALITGSPGSPRSIVPS